VLSVLVGGLIGCKPKPIEGILGDAAPAVGATPFDQFIVGKWSQGSKPSDPKKPTGTIMDIQAGGRFSFTYSGRKFDGKYTVQGPKAVLEFQLLDGQPLDLAMKDIAKRAEGGGQAAIAEDIFMDWIQKDLRAMEAVEVGEDGKTLEFTSARPAAPAAAAGAAPAGGEMDMGSMQAELEKLSASMNPPLLRIGLIPNE
jgi:hypothetical protein